MTQKYELLKDDTIEHCGRTLYRIKALISFDAIVAGELGGYIETENNLDHNGNAWVFGNAKVFGNAWVSDNAQVFDNAKVYSNAQVFDNAKVCGNTEIFGNAQIYDNAKVSGNARIHGAAKVCGNAWVSGSAFVNSSAFISERKMIFWASNVGSENGTLSVFNGQYGLIVTRGCFTGTVDEFLSRSKKVHDDKTHHEYKLLIEVAQSRILN